MGKTARGLPIWAQWVLPFATGLLGVMGGLIPWLLSLPSSNLQNRIQKANSDMQRVQVIIEIIEKADPEYLHMLDSLIVTIEDVEWRKAMTWIVEAKRKSLVVIRTEVEEEEPPVRIEPDLNVQSAKDPMFDSTCAIFYLKGDSIAKRDAEDIRGFLLKETKSHLRNDPFRYYPTRAKDTSWFDDNYPLVKSASDTNKNIFIFYNLPDPSCYAMKPYYYLKEGIFGIVYKEERNGSVNHAFHRDSLLQGHLFEDVSHIPLSKPEEKLDTWNFAIVIPPYFLTEAVLDSIFESGFE